MTPEAAVLIGNVNDITTLLTDLVETALHPSNKSLLTLLVSRLIQQTNLLHEAKEAAAAAPKEFQVALEEVHEILISEDGKEDWNERCKKMKQLYHEWTKIPQAIYLDSETLTGFNKPTLERPPPESGGSSPSSASSLSSSRSRSSSRSSSVAPFSGGLASGLR